MHYLRYRRVLFTFIRAHPIWQTFVFIAVKAQFNSISAEKERCQEQVGHYFLLHAGATDDNAITMKLYVSDI